ncbi:MAG TPA: NAD(P)-dependent oxidoreductase [Spirochaetes bacterium]|nr:NAD(P)-dependent oxidoreductase [Spirochaetota bacterium]
MNKNQKILVTGANGFIGSHILKYLSDKKEYEVTGLVRKTSDLFRLGGKKYRLLYASLDEPMEGITRGMDIVVHTAAISNIVGCYKDIYRANVDGTLKLIKASVKNGVRRFVHFSSTVVYGFNGNVDTTEDKAKNPFNNNYCKTKTLTEERLEDFKDLIELIILRPSCVFGPMDTKYTYLLLKNLENGLPGFIKGGKSLTSPCYVDNLVSAAHRAVITEKGLGEAFNITDGNDIPWKTFLGMAAGSINSRPPRIPVPPGPIFVLAKFLKIFHDILKTKNPPVISPYTIAMAAKNFSFSIEKAKKLLNYQPVCTTAEGIKKSAVWYLEHKTAVGTK